MSAPSSATVCRFGWDCRRSDCWFQHPNGRKITNDPEPSATSNANISNSQNNPQANGLGLSLGPGGLPISVGLGLAHPVIGDSATSPSNTSQGQQAQAQAPGQNMCRYGIACHRPDCWYSHPPGRALPSPPPNQNHDEVDEVLDQIEAQGHGEPGEGNGEQPELEGEGNQAEGSNASAFDFGGSNLCPCCNGQPYNCQNKHCSEKGVCGCQFGSDENNFENDNDLYHNQQHLDDSWRDEWFAASRDCACCHGNVYRCAHQLPNCTQNACQCFRS